MSNIIADSSQDSSDKLSSQITIVNIYTLVAVLYCAAFSSIFYGVANSVYLGRVHLLALVAILINWLALQKTRNFELANAVILIIGTIVVLSLFVTGGWGGTGYVWTFAYLPFPLFLTRGRISSFWVGLLFVSCLTVYLGSLGGAFDLPYSRPTLLNFFASFITFVILILSFLKTRDNLSFIARKREKQVTGAYEELKYEVLEHKKSETTLRERTQELERLNKAMVGRELKMIELKKEISDLKHAPKGQKKA